MRKSYDIVSRIVQTTNSQTVISSRDLKANDPIQQKLETELKDKDFFYERKKNSYPDEPRSQRLDAQVVGQVLMAFYLGRPYEVKFRRREIFGRYYSEVFDEESINADNILIPFSIFQMIEKKKVVFQRSVRNLQYDPRMLFLPHASFFILYGIGIAMEKHHISCSYDDISKVIQFYNPTINILADMVEKNERERGKQYSHNSFFRDRRTVDILKNKIQEIV